jgi:hypothetical protein
VPDQQPLGHVRGPGVGERRRRGPGQARHQPRRPGAGQHEHRQQQSLLDHRHRQHPGQQVGQQLGRHQPAAPSPSVPSTDPVIGGSATKTMS